MESQVSQMDPSGDTSFSNTVGVLDDPDLMLTSSSKSAKMLNLQETLAENILLKRELRSKLEQIVLLRNQLRQHFANYRAAEAIEAGSGHEHGDDVVNVTGTAQAQRFFYDSSGDAHPQLDFSQLFENSAGMSYNSSVFFQEVPDSEHEAPRNANHTISESIIGWVETNRSDVIQKVSTGTLMVRDLTLGGVSGWVGAYVLKKFGATALTALGGGLLLLQLAQHGGYIVVDWNQIYDRLEQTATELEGGFNPNQSEAAAESSESIVVKLKKLRKWGSDNRHFALGVLAGFLYKTYSS